MHPTRSAARAALTSTLVALAALLVMAVVLSTPSVARAAEGGGDGKAVFLAQKCNLCHSIASQGIESKATSEKTKGPDLSGVGAERDVAWITKFLKREEKLDGKPHKKEWKGTDAELQTLALWLSQQKKAS